MEKPSPGDAVNCVGFINESQHEINLEDEGPPKQASDDMHASQRPSAESEHRMQRRMGVSAEDAPYDITYHPGRVQFYAPPMQRQRWGETQVLPRVNWGDLFFDLFYVAATYNVSNIVVQQPDKEGLLYAAGTFLPVMGFWMDKTSYDARFVNGDDLFHRVYQTLMLCIIALAILHIRPVEIMSNSSENSSMLVFCACLVIERILVIGLYADIYYCGVGQRVVKKAAFDQICRMLIPGLLYGIGAVLAGIEYFGRDTSASTRDLAEVDNEVNSATEDSTFQEAGPNFTRNIPILLCLLGHVGFVLALIVWITFFFPAGGRHKEITVPLNIAFVIHRNGEWIMLMLGESIFSILIVDIPDEGSDFYITFYSGILLVILLQILHFRSQPHDPNVHAMRRHKNAGILWNAVNQIYSCALVSLGAAFTFFLTNFELDSSYSRQLAEGGSGLSVEEAEEKAAHIFCGSLSIVFLSLDVMEVLHLGVDESKDRCLCEQRRTYNGKGIALLAARIGLLVFTGTLSQWVTGAEVLCCIVASCVLMQLLLRKLGAMYLIHHQISDIPEK